ncbi:MAG: C40 family peptidase, partial [Lachnospiraceae bacterium]|nr:C40 family peptidase [Lachnospiraceae bacterium]
RKYGYSLPRTSREQARCGTKISMENAKPGDLVFYGKGGTVNHVGIYIGNGQIVNASNRRTGIKVSNATYRTPYAVRRVLQ